MSTIAVTVTSKRERRGMGRPDLHNMQAHPARRVQGHSAGRARGCAVVRPASPSRQEGSGVWLRVKVAAVTVVAIVGAAVGVSGYVSAVADPVADGPVAGDAAWSHVEP